MNGTFLDNFELTPIVGTIGIESILLDATARRYSGLPEIDGRAKLEDLSATAKSVGSGGWMSADLTLSTTADQTPIAPGRRVSDVVRDGRRVARFVSEVPMREASFRKRSPTTRRS